MIGKTPNHHPNPRSHRFITKLLQVSARFSILATLAAAASWQARPASAQLPADTKPSFEVASIKPAQDCNSTMPLPGGGTMKMRMPVFGFKPARYEACGALKDFVMEAYQDERDAETIAGGPDWFDKTDFQIEAKAENAVARQQMRLMLQSLLEERFKLKLHRESRERKVYWLTVEKNGPKFRQSKDDAGNPITQRPPLPLKVTADELKKGVPGLLMPNISFADRTEELRGKAVTLASLAASLRTYVGRKVIDKTGLVGFYDFELRFTSDRLANLLSPASSGIAGPGPTGSSAGSSPIQPPAEAGGPSIFGALQKQLGLKLEENKVSQDYIVIDSAEMPSEN